MERDNCFDFLRFLFAFNVVLGHLMVVSTFEELNAYSYLFKTHLSVTGFFVISGFLIAKSFERSSSLKSYFAKRARRLLPAYLLVILGCAFGLVSLSTLPAVDYFQSPDLWKYLGANLCFLNFLHPSLPGVFDNPLIRDTAVNGSLWTLKIEVGFYLIIPLLMMWLKKSKRPWLLLLVIYISALLYKTGLNALGDYTQHKAPYFLAHQLPGFMDYFAVGMAAYLYKDWFLRHKGHLILPALVLFLLEWCCGFEIFTSLAWGIIVLWCAYSLPALNNFAKFGDISYGIYIYHGPILKILLTLGLFTQIGIWPAAAVFIACVIVCGFASWHLLENRFLKRK